jgi:hypothetical protein
MRSVRRQESKWIQALVRDVERLVERHWLRRHPWMRSLVDEPPVAEAHDPGLLRDISDPAQGTKRTCSPVAGHLRRGHAQAWAGDREAGRRLGRRRRRRRLRAVQPLTVEVTSASSRAGDRMRHRAAKGTAVDVRPKRRERGERDGGEQHESGPLDRRLSKLPCHPATVRLGGAPMGAVCDISVRSALHVADDSLLAAAAIAQEGFGKRGAARGVRRRPGRSPGPGGGPAGAEPAEAGAGGSAGAAAAPAASGAVRLGAQDQAENRVCGGWPEAFALRRDMGARGRTPASVTEPAVAGAGPPAWARVRAPGRGPGRRRGRPGGAATARAPGRGAGLRGAATPARHSRCATGPAPRSRPAQRSFAPPRSPRGRRSRPRAVPGEVLHRGSL